MKTIFGLERLGSNRLRSSRRLGWSLLGVVLAGCSATPPDPIVIRGSNTIGEALLPRLVVEYKREHPTVKFDLEFKGTSYGIGALIAGRCDLAAGSRELNKNEPALAKDLGVELEDHVIGAYSVAVIVHAGSPVANLTREQVHDIFTGAITNWRTMGGPDAPIHLYIRDLISGTHLGFRELAMENKLYGPELKTFTNYGAIAEAVAQDPGGIGYVSLDLTTREGITAVSIGGVAPTVAAVNQGKYPYARVLRFYTDKSKESEQAQDFLRMIQSPGGQKILAQMGFVPRP